MWLTDRLGACAECDPGRTAAPVPAPVLPVPVAPCAGRLPVALAGRIVAEFSDPGNVVVVTPAGTGLVCAAARAGRLVVALAPTPAAAQRVEAELVAQLGVFDHPGVDVRVGFSSALSAPVHRSRRFADLVVLPVPCATATGDDPVDGSPGQDAGQDAQVFAACARVLRPGGLVIAASREGFPPGRAGALISQARAAGLVYLQHLVAVHARVADGQLWCEATAAERALVRWVGDPRVHLPAHSDLVVLTRPTTGGTRG